MKLARRTVTAAALALAALAGLSPIAAGPLAPAPAEAATTRTYGGGPLDEVVAAAAAHERTDCGLGRERLAAMMIAPTFSETGAPTTAAPGPMTLSRWDTQAALWAFGDTSTPYQKAFWHPGVGMWQFDSAGFWPLTAATAIDTRTSARQAASVMSTRYCASQATSVGDKMRYAWAPWYYCATPGDNPCILKFRDHYGPDGLQNLTRDESVGRLGGMQQHTCRIAGGADLPCARVDPARAQGYAAWANPSFGPTPVSAPFYVIERDGREVRYWLRQDTGYSVTVVASKPVTANARTSLTWSVLGTSGATLCDVTAGRGECGGTFGSLERVDPLPGVVDVEGWAADPDTSAAIDVRIRIDGVVRATVRADDPRPDVGAAYPALGPNHGFRRTVTADAGSRRVCVEGVDTAPPIVGNTEIGCRTVVVPSGSPVGNLEAVRAAPGVVNVTGWALDPNTPAPISVHVYVDGVGRANVLADRTRTDVGAAFPSLGPDHGFSIPLTGLPGGDRRVCVYAINVGAGANVELGCRTVRALGGSPVGTLEAAFAGPRQIEVSGWALDPDSAAPIPVHVYVDGVGRANVPAERARADVASAFPAYGPNHGYSLAIGNVAPGPHQVCVYGIDVAGTGGNVLLGCRQVTVPGGSPIGVLEAATAGPGTIDLAGWAIDPDTIASIPVHVYVDGVGRANLTADRLRPDLVRHFPAYGSAHGFGTRLSGIAPGTRQVCAYGIDLVRPGGNVLLGCRTVVVPGGSPIGSFDGLAASGGTITASGWALDPDTAAPIPVHVYVDGVGTAVLADRARPDVGAAFPLYGPGHGWQLAAAVAPGRHEVCAYAINVGVGSTGFLGCRTITT